MSSSNPVTFEFVKLTLITLLKFLPLISIGANGEPWADPFKPLIPTICGESWYESCTIDIVFVIFLPTDVLTFCEFNQPLIL